MGKDRGVDFREGKVKLPVIIAYARGSADDRRFWQQSISGRAGGAEALERAVALVRDTGAITDTRARAGLYGSRAIDALSALPPSPARAALAEAVQFAVQRAY